MNSLLIQSNTKHLYLIMILMVTLVGAGFAPGPLLAQSSTPTCTPVPKDACKDWPCKDGDSQTVCDGKRADVARVLVDLLNEASKSDETGKQLRNDLLCPTNNFQLAHEAIRKKLDTVNVKFGPEHQVIFYEPEYKFNENGEGVSFGSTYPANHCIHIFALPEPGTDLPHNGVEQIRKSMNLHFKCCYKPW